MANQQQPVMAQKSPLKTSERLLMSLSFLAFVNTAALFHMNNRVPNKKWKQNGWIILFINIF
ncbi:MAG: hypothetical protein IJ077_00245, partial [Eubacterium sp.]|nr:hypothetical protein [Eubacterium sp.]